MGRKDRLLSRLVEVQRRNLDEVRVRVRFKTFIFVMAKYGSEAGQGRSVVARTGGLGGVDSRANAERLVEMAKKGRMTNPVTLSTYPPNNKGRVDVPSSYSLLSGSTVTRARPPNAAPHLQRVPHATRALSLPWPGPRRHGPRPLLPLLPRAARQHEVTRGKKAA